ncbi:hypothetical protein JL720_5462 [Aureococcus anophagefferens]|nr:hypothetical protein JL720_5462 [Aureococcus anophagefferens]
MSSLSRRQVRLRREYLYRRSLEGKEKVVYEKKRKISEALAAGKAIPTELREEEGELRKLIEYDGARHAAPGSPRRRADAKRVCTFYNAADRISFRHHTYERDGPDVHLTELGPRFEMTPYMIKLGTLDQADADVEWVLRPYMNSAKKII